MSKFLIVILTKFQELDQELYFEPNIESLCKKASQKFNALSRIASSLKFGQRK